MEDVMEGLKPNSSAIRYRPTATASQPIVRPRASLKTGAQPVPVLERPATNRTPRRPAEQPRTRRREQDGVCEPITRATGPRPTPYQAHQAAQVTYDLNLDDEQSAQARTVPLDDTSEDDAQTTLLTSDPGDIQVRLPVPYRRPQQQTRISHQRKHALVFVGVGMAAMLALWLLAVQVMVAWTNTVHDPGYYTQTAHLDTVTISTDAQGHQSQVRAFIDAQGHLDMLVLPVSDSSKAHVVIGPTLSSISDPQKATITVTAKGTVVTVTIQGPLQANFLATTRQRSVWSIDLKKTGGH